MPVTKLSGFTLLLLGLMDPKVQALSAQGAQRSAAADVARSLRASGADARALPILTQARGAQSLRVMDEVADTLAAVAINPSPDDLVNARARSIAISILERAGTGSPGVAGVARGLPFEGAAERLQRIAETSHYVDARQSALRSLSELNRTPAFLQYLRQLAVAPTGIAAMAVEILVTSRGPEGRAIARDLYKTNAIKNYEALWILQGKAAALGW